MTGQQRKTLIKAMAGDLHSDSVPDQAQQRLVAPVNLKGQPGRLAEWT